MGTDGWLLARKNLNRYESQFRMLTTYQVFPNPKYLFSYTPF